MAKYAAFDAMVEIGTAQVETCTVVVTNVTDGNSNWILTASGMTGSAITTVVALAGGETAHEVAVLAAAEMNTDSDITDLFDIIVNGDQIIITANAGRANDATLNLEYADDTSGGLADDDTSDATTAGVAASEVAAVTNISGPGLSLDTEDVTSHDSTNAWEEVVGTILRSGELTMDIVYDPAGGTHDATTGLVYRHENKIKSWFDFTFMSTYNWTFFGYITGFEPSAPVGGALTASVTVKIDGEPTLE